MVGDKHTLDVTPALSPAEVRGFVRSLCGDLPEGARDSLELLVAEVVLNATRHGELPVTLEVTGLAGTTRVIVRSGGDPFRWRGRSPAKAGQGGGLGLVLVDGIADRWGMHRASGQNQVWFEVDH